MIMIYNGIKLATTDLKIPQSRQLGNIKLYLGGVEVGRSGGRAKKGEEAPYETPTQMALCGR